MLQKFGKKWVSVFPVVLFFIVLFYTMILFFGTKYSIMVSFATTQFKVRYQKKFTPRLAARLVGEQVAICLLAFFATLNLPLCIGLNLVVPFFLVYLQSTQFNPKGYFANAMAFVFLQLRPVGWSGFLPMAGAVSYVIFVLAAALAIYAYIHRKPQDYGQEKKGISLLSQAFGLLAEGKRDSALQTGLLAVQGALHQMAYSSRGSSRVVRGEGKTHYMFALMFQRAAYFLEDYVPGKGKREADAALLLQLAGLMGRIQDGVNLADNEPFIQEASELLDGTDVVTGRFRLFVRDFLHLLSMALQDMTVAKGGEGQQEWQLPSYARPFRGMRQRMRLDHFEVRFALRLSLVMAVSMAVSKMANINHSYWLPLNAFLLVQPMYEDSAHRLKTRLAGTLLGSGLVMLVLSHLKAAPWHFLFATVTASFLYYFTPGTVAQAVSSTSFALSLTSLTMASSTAVELRIAYVAMAVVLVLVANQFFFPTSKKRQFEFNIRELFHIQDTYLGILALSTRRDIDYGVMSEALTHFHLVYGQAREYLVEQGEWEDAAAYKSMMEVMWKMVAEAEQMVVYVQTEGMGKDKKQAVVAFTGQMRGRLGQVEALYGKEPRGHQEAEVPVLREPYLGHLMAQYGANMELLYQACQAVAHRWQR